MDKNLDLELEEFLLKNLSAWKIGGNNKGIKKDGRKGE